MSTGHNTSLDRGLYRCCLDNDRSGIVIIINPSFLTDVAMCLMMLLGNNDSDNIYGNSENSIIVIVIIITVYGLYLFLTVWILYQHFSSGEQKIRRNERIAQMDGSNIHTRT